MIQAKDMRPEFVLCRRCDEAKREHMAPGSTVRLCTDCLDEVWVSPSTVNVEGTMGRRIPALCEPCLSARRVPWLVGFITNDGADEARLLARRRRQ